MNELKRDIEENPQKYNTIKDEQIEYHHTNYTIINKDLQEKIKEILEKFNAAILIKPIKHKSILYNLKITKDEFSSTIIQYVNGTLTIQGKNNDLFQEICDSIESTANPSEEEVITRFISNNEDALKEHSIKFSPEILEKAKMELKGKIADVYNYLDEYNRKLYIVGQTLYLYNLEHLPEYSFIVMPVSKGFEGFIKKLSIDINLIDPNYWKTSSNFGFLMDKNNTKRKNLCSKELKVKNFLRKIDSTITFYRHFMMHSEDSPTNRIYKIEDAYKKVDILFSETKEIFDYFNNLVKLI